MSVKALERRLHRFEAGQGRKWAIVSVPMHWTAAEIEAGAGVLLAGWGDRAVVLPLRDPEATGAELVRLCGSFAGVTGFMDEKENEQ